MCEAIRKRPLTPEKGKPMPQTREYWEKRAQMDQELILSQKAEISRLNARINKLSYGKSQARLHEVKEIYANMEGLKPETSIKGYLLRTMRKMYEVAAGIEK